MPPVALSGELAPLSLADALLELHRTAATGILVVEQEGNTRQFFVSDGNLRFARSTDPAERLGALLQEWGRVDNAAIAQALASSMGQRLGQALVEGGSLSPDELNQVVTNQLLNILVSALSIPRGRMHFEEGPWAEQGGIQLQHQTPFLVLTVLRVMPDASIFVGRLRDENLIPRVSLQGWTLPGPLLEWEETTLNQVDGQATVRDIWEISTIGLPETCRVLAILEIFGVIECAHPPAYEHAGGLQPLLDAVNPAFRRIQEVLVAHLGMERARFLLGQTMRAQTPNHPILILMHWAPDGSMGWGGSGALLNECDPEEALTLLRGALGARLESEMALTHQLLGSETGDQLHQEIAGMLG